MSKRETNDARKLRAVAAALRDLGRKAGPRGRKPALVPDEEREATRQALLLAVTNLDIINRACNRYGCAKGVTCAGVFDRLRTAAAEHDRGGDLGGYWCWAHDLTGEHLPGNVSFPDELGRWASRLEQEPAESGEAEDLQPTSCLTSLQVIGSGRVYDGWEALREILASASRRVDLEDAHINADVVALLRSAPDRVAVRVLTKKLYEDADPAFRRLAKQKSGTLEVRTTADLHPRRVYVDDRAYILDDSIKDLASKTASCIVPVDKPIETRRLTEDFERRWATAGVRIRPKA